MHHVGSKADSGGTGRDRDRGGVFKRAVGGGRDQARRCIGAAGDRCAELFPARRQPRGEGWRAGHPGDQSHRQRFCQLLVASVYIRKWHQFSSGRKRYISSLAQTDTKRLFIVARKVKAWGLSPHTNIILFEGTQARGAHLGSHLGKIQQYLYQ